MRAFYFLSNVTCNPLAARLSTWSLAQSCVLSPGKQGQQEARSRLDVLMVLRGDDFCSRDPGGEGGTTRPEWALALGLSGLL